MSTEHHRLCLAEAVQQVTARASEAFGAEALVERYPFVRGYLDQLGATGGPGIRLSLRAIEAALGTRLPTVALKESAHLDERAVSLLMAIGLVEEDARFGALFDEVQGTANLRRPTVGLLNAWWREETDRGEVRAALRRLFEAGLLKVVNPEAPRLDQALEVVPFLWDAMRGETSRTPAPGIVHRTRGELLSMRELLLSERLSGEVARLPALLASGEVDAVIVRGAKNNGRRTLAFAIARETGAGILEVNEPIRPDDERFRTLGALATLTASMPVVVVHPGLGETALVPKLAAYRGVIGVVMGKQGGIGGPGAERAVTIDMPVPDERERKKHWRAGLGDMPFPGLDAVAASGRMTAGNIRRTAAIARSYAVLASRSGVEIEDVRRAARAVHRQGLDALASRVEVGSLGGGLVVRDETREELEGLFARCRHREALRERVGPVLRGQVNMGVRALFHGPSGTGKTLAAKTLAARLGMDLYRVDLASVVSKYIGETEKNLGQIFAVAEELDVMLLFDEGDSLFAQRTSVQTSNDRYANLETNYLLQRIETFEGIVVVTTNAADLVDTAFQRRMDVIVDFPAPEAEERLAIWRAHLPASPELPAAFLDHLASQCVLSGGQIRNAVLHASLLALSAGRSGIAIEDVEAAVIREYRRMGAMAPMDVG